MKKVAIMQPYLFPYIGYFQLLNAVDEFVILDNVQYINRGWINRNNLLVNGQKKLFTFSLKSANSKASIRQREFSESFYKEAENFLKTFYFWYQKSPHYIEIEAMLRQILSFADKNVSSFIVNSLNVISKYMEIDTSIQLASELGLADEVNGQERIIQICKSVKAEQYINPIGGVELYSERAFRENGIDLLFLKTNETLSYKQFQSEFYNNLSIIDVLAHNSREKNQVLLKEFELLPSIQAEKVILSDAVILSR